jgi:uncharacterized DUF497 family protein
MALRFEWNVKKAEANFSKHDVSFEEAVTVFADPLARIFADTEHSVARNHNWSFGAEAANTSELYGDWRPSTNHKRAQSDPQRT